MSGPAPHHPHRRVFHITPDLLPEVLFLNLSFFARPLPAATIRDFTGPLPHLPQKADAAIVVIV